MNNRIIFSILSILIALFCISCNSPSGSYSYPDLKSISNKQLDKSEIKDSTVYQLQKTYPHPVIALLDCYPGYIIGYENNNLIFQDSSILTYDDGQYKEFEEMLDNSDVEDMFSIRYRDPIISPMYLEDAGRFRSEELFKKLYGNSQNQVRQNLVKMDWFGEPILFNSLNGASDQLRKVADELASYPELFQYLKTSGTFYWRKVRGSNRLSAHSYGIAIDIGIKYSDYWKWKYPNASETAKIQYINRLPDKIVKIFHKHGFIWGGSWYHFDTMHFEYRPELIRFAELSNV